MTTITYPVLAWLLTYAIHSTVILGAVWFVSRRPNLSAAARDMLWKTALVGGIVTATAQLQLGVRPLGSFALEPVPQRESASPMDGAADNSLVAAPGAASQGNTTVAKDERETDTSSAGAIPPASAASRFSFASAAVVAWGVLGLALTLAYLARRLILVGRLGDRRMVSEGSLPGILESLRKSSGHRGEVRLTSSSTISSPVALGLGEICVPDAVLTELDSEQQRGLLAHELAHLARRDPLWLDGASLIERLFFFQPLNRLARRELQRVAEYLCDDWAAERSGSGLPLARCLERVAEWIQASPLGVPVAGMAEQRSLLVVRIARLIDPNPAPSPARRGMLVLAAVGFLAATVAAAPGVQRNALIGAGAQPGGDPAAQHGPAISGRGPDDTQSPSPGGSPSPSPSPSPSGAPSNAQPETPQDSSVVRALIERLKDTDAGVRRAAASSLGRLKARRAVRALIDALDDRDREVRSAIAEALGELGDDRAVTPLTELLADPSPDVRHKALEALSHYARQVPAAPVIAALRDANAEVRGHAAGLLGEIRDRASVGPLTRLLADPIPDVRMRALEALKEIRDPAVGPDLLPLLKDPNPDVRHAALHAVHDLNVPVSERALIEAMGDENADVRQTAVGIVGDRPFAQAIATLLRLLDDPNGDVREAAVSALGEINSPAARDALRTALSSRDPKVRQRATEVLGGKP